MRLESTSQRMPPVQYVTTGRPLRSSYLPESSSADEVAGRLDVGHDRVLESADRRLERIATVEERDVVAALGDEFMQFVGRESGAAADHAVVADAYLAGRAERHDLVAHLDAELREVEARAGVVEARFPRST